MRLRIRFAILSLCLISSPSFAKLAKYVELESKDYDEMMKLVNSKISASRKAGASDVKNSNEDDSDDEEAVAQLRDGVRLVLARPNKDSILSDLISPLRHELTQYEAYDETMVKVVTDALSAIGDSHLSVGDRATYFFVLRNAMSEMKPEIQRKPAFKKSLETIRDAKIQIPSDVRKELMMPSMYNLESPSETAKVILAHLPPSNQPTTNTPTPDPSQKPTKKHKIEVFQ
jgi:hypothetical protein